ncbi:MAG TPA: efflux RND transporter periplasmic adaptor subunit, partial [Burkholderiaceae bacterium]|nr:efflux RND transporter periplasmic adaptor subunit [Burkholderiaceae bacterium]
QDRIMSIGLLPLCHTAGVLRAPALRGVLMLSASIVLAACQSRADTPPPGPHGGPPVSVAPAVQRQVQESDEFTGRLEAPQSVDVRPRVTGYIKKVHFHDGQEVKAGDLLFTIDPDPYLAELAKARAQLAAAQTQVELARSEEARAHKLIDVKAISQQEYDQLTSGSLNAAANVQAAEAAVQSAELNVGYTQIRAPIAGRVSRANVTAGNLVNPGDPVLTSLVSLDQVYAYFDAGEDAYLRYLKSTREARPGSQPHTNPVLMGLADEQGYPHRGVMDFVDNRLNPQTGAMRTRAVFDNAERRFTPGLFARIRLLGSGTYTAVLTPEQAIGTDQTKKFVLVIGQNNTAQFREVALGSLVDGMRVVKSGLFPGDLVVVDGLQRVRPGQPVTPEKLQIDDRGMPIRKAEPAAGQS